MDTLSQIKEYSKKLAGELSKALANVNVKEIKGNGTFKVIATTSSVDRDGESILVEGWTFENFMKNPIILFGHNYWDMCCIIGAATNITVQGKEVVVEGVFANTEEGQYIRQLYDDGILKTVSVGFIPLERQANIITKAELLEISFVPVPANPEALSMAKAVKAAMDFEKKFIKSAVPYAECPMADEATKWDQTAALENLEEFAEGTPGATGDDEGTPADPEIDFAVYKEGFAYVDSSNTEDGSGYKLPHHDVADGKLVVVWEGVQAAMTALLAADGASIPEADRQGVYDHLAAHYKQFGKTAPEMPAAPAEPAKTVKVSKSALEKMKSDISSILDSYVVEGTEEPSKKSGRVLSTKNESLVKTALDAVEAVVKPLQELLAAVNDPTDEGKLMTTSDAKILADLLKGADKLIEKAICNVKPLAKK